MIQIFILTIQSKYLIDICAILQLLLLLLLSLNKFINNILPMLNQAPQFNLIRHLRKVLVYKEPVLFPNKISFGYVSRLVDEEGSSIERAFVEPNHNFVHEAEFVHRFLINFKSYVDVALHDEHDVVDGIQLV